MYKLWHANILSLTQTSLARIGGEQKQRTWRPSPKRFAVICMCPLVTKHVWEGNPHLVHIWFPDVLIKMQIYYGCVPCFSFNGELPSHVDDMIKKRVRKALPHMCQDGTNQLLKINMAPVACSEFSMQKSRHPDLLTLMNILDQYPRIAARTVKSLIPW